MAFGQCYDTRGCRNEGCLAQHHPDREKFLEGWKKHNEKAENTHNDKTHITTRGSQKHTKKNDDKDNNTEEIEQKEIEKKHEEANRELKNLSKTTQDTGERQNNEEGKINKRYPMNVFYRNKTRGDGYCIIQSVIKCLRHIGIAVSSRDNLLEDLRKELTTKIETYRQAINTLETDPIRELEEYTKSGKYNSNLGDLIIPLLSNQQKIRVVLLQQRDEEYVLEHEGHVYAPEGYEKTIYLEKEPLHYNALLPETRKSERKRTTEGGKELESEAERSVKENTNKVMVEKDVTDKKVEETQVNTQENTQENSEEENQEAPLQTEKEEKCSICGEEWQGFHIECSTCQTWYHGECVGVNEDEIEEKEEYTCPSCAKEKKKLDKEESKYYRDREQEIKKQHKTKVEKLNQKITSLTEDIKKRKTKMEEEDK